MRIASNLAVSAGVTRYPLLMPKKEPELQTTPKGTPIPTPTRGEFDANLDKLLKAPKPPKKVVGRRRVGGSQAL
jgi:hypothetical protein